FAPFCMNARYRGKSASKDFIELQLPPGRIHNLLGALKHLKGDVMKKQFVLTGLSLSGILVCVLIVGLAAGFAVQNGQRGPAAPAAPCGPNIAGDLGTNAAKSSRCFELRMYTVDTSKSRINDLHTRFRDGEVAIFKKNGMEVLGAWQSLDDPNTLIYLLAH